MQRCVGQRSGWSLSEAIGLAAETARPSTRSVSKCPDDFDRLVAEFHRPVTRLAQRLLGWRGEVEDVVHDVFLAALKHRDRFRGDASTWTWLAAITINRCRTQRRRQLTTFRWLRWARNQSPVPIVQSGVERDETAARVRDAVAALPVKDREVVVLYYLEELSVAEISRLIGASTGAIDVRLHRARGRLKKLLGEFTE
jgi:RNA polymerase sigma factor (sigma-70 family)